MELFTILGLCKYAKSLFWAFFQFQSTFSPGSSGGGSEVGLWVACMFNILFHDTPHNPLGGAQRGAKCDQTKKISPKKHIFAILTVQMDRYGDGSYGKKL